VSLSMGTSTGIALPRTSIGNLRVSVPTYTSNMDVGCSQWGFSASTMTPQHHTGSAIIPHFPSNSPPPCARITAIKIHPYAHPQHLKVLNTLYTSNMDVGCSQWGFSASTSMTPQHHTGSAMPQFS
jgi:zinc transporter ZupT